MNQAGSQAGRRWPGRAARALALLAMLAVTGCATPGGPARAQRDAAELAGLLAGRFDNARQVAALPDGVERRPAPGQLWLDAQWALHRAVGVSAVPGRSLYLEWRAGAPDARITRQRLWSVVTSPDGPRMAFYTFRAPEALAGGDPAALARLGAADLTGFPEACWVRFRREGRGWLGRIEPAACSIVAASGRSMALDVTIRVSRGGFDYQERGILPDGSDAFFVPSLAPYRFERQSDPRAR